jgi:hypothetical protein
MNLDLSINNNKKVLELEFFKNIHRKKIKLKILAQ